MKVVFFDSWTRGLHNYLPLHAALSAHGVESLLLHRGSWGAEPDRPTDEVLDGLVCRDIRRYHGLVYAALRAERPNLVVILTTNYIADRAVILAARALGIPTCFLMHGIRNATTEGRAADDAAQTMRFLRAERWKRAVKYLRYTIPNYFLSGVMASPLFPFRVAPYRTLVQTFLRPEQHVLYPDPSPELNCDRALVWAEVYRDLFIAHYGYPVDRVRVVGHPPLDPVFGLRASPPTAGAQAAFLAGLGIAPSARFAVYLEDGFVESGFEGWTVASRIGHLEEIARACSEAERLLVVKLHPVSNTGEIESHFAGDGRVRLVARTNLPLLLYLAESAIAHISSTVDMAVSLGKPVLVPRWGISSSVPDYFLHRGVGVACESPESLRGALQDPTVAPGVTPEGVRRYVQRFITLCDGHSVDRIVGSFLEQMGHALAG